MTVCIGALCQTSENGVEAGAVVVASDRMVTLGQMQEFEHEIPKITPLGDKSVTLIAGDALRGSQVVRDTKYNIAPGSSMITASQILAEKYAALRDHHIEVDIFRPRGLTREIFYKSPLPGLQPQVAFQLDNMVGVYNLGVELLLAGVDDAGAHLYQVRNPGAHASNLQQIGYGSIGSGALHAMQSLVAFGQTPKHNLAETIFAVYASKRRAEVAPGVGRDTDLAIIRQSGIVWLAKDKLAELDKIFTEFIKPASDSVVEQVKRLL